MSVKTGLATLAAASLLAVGLGTNAIAGSNDEDEKAAIASAQISLGEAIALAETEVGVAQLPCAVVSEIKTRDGAAQMNAASEDVRVLAVERAS